MTDELAILYVDDEAANLTAFRYEFDDSFRVLTAGSAAEALDVLDRERVAVLLADQRMPEVSGIELCRRAREKHPDVVRMIVTAYAEVSSVTEALNKGQVSRYILKPWRSDTMADVLRAGVEAYQLGALTRELQARLVRADQQATTTFLLGRVLHEIGNPAAALHNNAAWLAEAFDAFAAKLAAGTADVAPALDELRAAVHDISASSRELTERIARFRRGEPASVMRDGGARLAGAVRSALSVVGAEVRKRARVALELVEDPLVVMDAVPLSQVVVNLLTNAWEAIDGASEDNRVVVRTYVSGRRALLEVEDTGRGVPDELAPLIFDPFRSDKAGDEPRGLGLAIVRDVVTAAGGAVHLRRPPSGRGALFVVELPLVATG